MYTIDNARIDMMSSGVDCSEDDLSELSQEEFCAKYRIPHEEWDMLQKEIQEM